MPKTSLTCNPSKAMNTRIPNLSAAQPRSVDSTQRTQPGSGKPQPPVQCLWPRRALVRWASVAFAILLGLHPNARADSTVVEWGDSISYDDTGVPADLTNVVAVAAGGVHSLALSVDGTVIAWGLNWWGQTDVPADLTNVVAVAAGWNHSVALKNDGTVIAWGDNSSGQTNVPPGLTNVVAVAAGGENTYPWGQAGGTA